MKFFIFETTPSFIKRPAPLLVTSSGQVSSADSTSTSSTAADEDDWSHGLEEEDDDEEDNDSLLDDLKNDDDGDFLQQEGRRRVRFAERQNTVYENTTMTRDQVRDLWYQKADFQAFKRATLDQAHDLLKANDDDDNNNNRHQAVIHALNVAYTGFCQVTTAADILTVLATCPIPCLHDPNYIGMDRYMVKAVVLDRSERKRRIYRQMTWWQAHRGGDAMLASQLRQVCRTASQPCRLYAHHVAQCALRSDAATSTTTTESAVV